MTTFAKQLRKSQTPTEAIMWGSLRNRKLRDMKFKRQFLMGPYIVDFFCEEHLLIIEIDGSIHYETDEAQVYDRKRQDYLEALGYRVMRFTTQDVQENLDAVLEMIGQVV